MGLDNPLNDPNGNIDKALTIIDFISTSVFGIEAVMKIMAFGFVLNGPTCYLRNYWNILDFIVLVMTVIFIF